MSTETPADNPQFHVRDGSGYMLDRNFTPASRLNLQFYLWKDSLKFNLHPSIPVSDHDSVRIADVGTGTAIWLIDLARELPHARLDGLDLDCSQAPPPAWLPRNVSMRTLNVLDDIPADLHRAYDIIHVRLFILVVENSDPRPIIANLCKMLKPGGWLQWDDIDNTGHHVVRADPSSLTATPALDRYREMIHAGGKHEWILSLAETLKGEGFVDAVSYRYTDSDALLKMNSDQHMMTVAEFASRLVKMGKEEEAARTNRMIDEAYGECLAGAAYTIPRVVTVAQKSKFRQQQPDLLDNNECIVKRYWELQPTHLHFLHERHDPPSWYLELALRNQRFT